MIKIGLTGGIGTGKSTVSKMLMAAGIKVLASDDAKKLYANCTAAVLRAKKCVMKTATNIQENAGDIYAEAKAINEEREAAAEAVDDMDEVVESDMKEETEA